MNILLFVTSLLMILALLTYTRIDNFRYFLGMQSEFERYMRTLERMYINKSAEHWYDTTIAKSSGLKDEAGKDQAPEPIPLKPEEAPKKPESSSAGSQPKPEQAEPIDLSKPKEKPKPQATPNTPTSRLSVRILFDQKMKDSNETVYHQTREWLKKLMKELYGEQLFFKRALEQHPDFLNELLNALEKTVQDLPEDERPKTVSDLANLKLPLEFEEVLYLMLKGCPKEELLLDTETGKKESKVKFIIEGEGEENIAEDETDDANEALEYTSSQGYDSLLNFITYRNTTKIRVYLASRELLTVIFGQSNAADAVIRMRTALYRSVLKDLPPGDATKQFQVAFQGTDVQDANSMLDFKITKTNPADYD